MGAYEGFTLYLCVPLLVQDDTNHDKEMADFSIAEINYIDLDNSSLQTIESIVGGATNIGGSFSPMKCSCNVEHR